MAAWRSLATVAPNKSGESGDPCRMPFVWGTVVMLSAMATLRVRVSSMLNQKSASHGQSPSSGGTGFLSEATPPTRAATSPPILCCHTLSNALRMSNLTSHVPTPQSRAICVTLRIVATSSTPCRPARAHWSKEPLRMCPPAHASRSCEAHFSRVDDSVIGLVSPHSSGHGIFGSKTMIPRSIDSGMWAV